LRLTKLASLKFLLKVQVLIQSFFTLENAHQSPFAHSLPTNMVQADAPQGFPPQGFPPQGFPLRDFSTFHDEADI